MKKFSDLNVDINVAASELQDTDQDGNVDPTQYKQDLDYILGLCEYKFCELDNTVTQCIRAIDRAKASIETKTARLPMNCLPISRNNSPERGFMVRSNANSMKHQLLTYPAVSLASLNDHMRNVLDWIENTFPCGHTLTQYRSNLNSTLDEEFRRWTNYFQECQTEKEIREVLNLVMEVKFLIHLR